MNISKDVIRLAMLVVVCLILAAVAAPQGACAETLRWTKRYNGPAGGSDNGYGVAVGADGSVVVAGSTEVAGQSSNVIVSKYLATGALTWSKTYNGAANASDEGYGVAVGPDGSVYVCGMTEVAGGSSDLLLLKYSSAGKLLWRKTYNGTANAEDVGAAVAVGPGGVVYVAGSVNGTDVLLQKYLPSGALRWSRTYNGPANATDRAQAIAVGPDGNIHLAGMCECPVEGDNIVVLQFSPAGAVRWSKMYNGGGYVHEQGFGIAVGRDRSVYVTGKGEVAGTDDLVLLKYSPAGALVWAKSYGGAASGADRGDGVAVGPDGSVFVAGAVSVAAEGTNVLLRKYGASGALRWSKTYGGAANGDDNAYDVAVGADGSVYLTGGTEVTGQGRNLLVQKYR